MASLESPSEFDDELLSAYIDDELTPEERARVEARLAEDPAAAQLVEELRHVSQAVKSLPPEKLSRDLRAGVLAGLRTERGDRSEERAVTLPFSGADRWAGVKRGLVWSAIAIAATLLLTTIQPEQPGDGELADRAEERLGGRPDAGDRRTGARRQVRSPDDIPALRAPAESVEKSDASSRATARSGEAGVGGGGGLRDASAPKEKDAESETKLFAASDAAKNDLAESLEAPSEPAAPAPSEAPFESRQSATEPMATAPASGAVGASDATSRLAGDVVPRGGLSSLDKRKENDAAIPGLQIVEVTLRGTGKASVEEFEKALADNRIELRDEALIPEAPEGAAAAPPLLATETILVEGTPEQIKQIVASFENRVLDVNVESLDHLGAPNQLDRKASSVGTTSILQRQGFKALADKAVQAADRVQANEVRGGRSYSAMGQAWRVQLRGAEERGAEAEARSRFAQEAPASTYSAASSPRAADAAAPASASNDSLSRASESGRLNMSRQVDAAPRVRVLFLLQPTADASSKKAAN